MEQLSLPFPQAFLAPPPPLVEIARVVAVPAQAFVRAQWAARYVQAAAAERAYWTRIAADNQLVLDFLDAGLTRRARRFAQGR